MKKTTGDLTQEGSTSFWVRLADNPHFSEPDSNIRFMLNANIGGVTLTVLKQGEFLDITLLNPAHGDSHIRHGISQYLSQDLMVVLTWSGPTVTLYLNGKQVDRQIADSTTTS